MSLKIGPGVGPCRGHWLGAAPSNFTRLASTTQTSSTSSAATTAPMNTVGANLIIVATGSSSFAGVPMITDSASNPTWTMLTNWGAGSGLYTTIFYCVNPITSPTHTFTASTGSGFPGICAAAYSASAASPFDQQSGGDTASGTTFQLPTIVPAQNGELVFVAYSSGGPGLSSISGPFTILQQTPGGSVAFCAIADCIQTTATTVNPTLTAASSSNVGGAMATFKCASPSGLTPLQQLAALPGLSNWWQARQSSGFTGNAGMVDTVAGKNTTGVTSGSASYSSSVSVLNGLPGIHTLASAMTTPSGTWPSGQSFSLALVLSVVSNINANSIFCDDDSGNNEIRNFGATDVRIKWQGAATDFTIPFSLTANTPILLLATYNSSTRAFHIRVNGQDCGTITVAAGDDRTGTLTFPGSQGLFAETYVGDFMMFNNSVLSSGNITTLESAFSSLYAYVG